MDGEHALRFPASGQLSPSKVNDVCTVGTVFRLESESWPVQLGEDIDG